MNQTIKQAIIDTLTYFDLFDFPLKEEEIWRWLFFESGKFLIEEKTSKREFDDCLKNLLLEAKIEQKDGFYFIFGRFSIIATRTQRQVISWAKIKKAEKLVFWWLKRIPWIKAVFLSNNISYLNASSNSDIDLFIITQKDRMWLARFLAVLPLKILNLRPTDKKKKDKFCLSYWVSQDGLNLEQYEAVDKIPILIYWSVFYRPLYAENYLWSSFCLENSWLKKYLPNIQTVYNFKEEARISSFRLQLQKLNLDKLDNIFRRLQLWYLPKKLKELINLDTRVVINQKVIKLHGESKSEKNWHEWQEKKMTINNLTEK